MSAPSPGWYLRRLRSMGPAEIAGRGVDTLRHLAWSRRQVLPGAAAVLPADLVPERTGPQALPPGPQTWSTRPRPPL